LLPVFIFDMVVIHSLRRGLRRLQLNFYPLMKNQLLIICTLLALVSLSYARTIEKQVSQRTLTEAEKVLVEDSMKAIIETGMSESYFRSHFKVFRVVNQPADRRVMWEFSLNGYQAIIKDSIGSYMHGQTRVDTHNISQTLGKTNDITTTIARPRALSLMKKCIGSFSEPSVQYTPMNGRAELLLVASASSRVGDRQNAETRERENEEKKKALKKSTQPGNDEIESEEEETKVRPVIFGYINLQTGKCTRSAGVASPLTGF
jgi:hypothetical protein